MISCLLVLPCVSYALAQKWFIFVEQFQKKSLQSQAQRILGTDTSCVALYN